MARDDNYNRMTRCSFCGKSEAMVHKLIEGPGVFICDECIRLCNDLIQSTELADAPGKQGEDGDMVLPKPAEIKDQLDAYVIGQDEAKKRCPLQYITTISVFSVPKRTMWSCKRAISC